MDAAELYTDDYRRTPEKVWARLRADHPLFHDTVSNVWVLSRYADVAAVFADHRTYSARTYEESTGVVLGPTLISMDDDEHVTRRSIVAPDFVGRRLQAYRPLIEACADHLIDVFAHAGQADLVDQLTRRLPVDVIAAMLGMTGDGDRFREWVTAMIMGLAPQARAEGRVARAEFCAHIAPSLRNVDDPARTDLIAKIARATHEGRRLDDDDITAFCGLLFIAGGETTDKAMSSMLWALMAHPDQFAAVLSDESRWDGAFSETMRRYAPVVAEDRYTTSPVQWHGTELPVGSRVRVMLGAAHLDDSVFVSPNEFDIERADLHLGKELRSGGSTEVARSGHLGFGLGKHFCIGYELARTESIIGSRRMIERCGVPSFIGQTPDPPALARSFRALAKLPVGFFRR
jgi:cytochrome P450